MLTNMGNTSDKFMTELLNSIGFSNVIEYKKYMLSHAKLNEYGAICHNEIRDGLTLNYSDNCKHKYGIGGKLNGTFRDYRFN
jgi:hypothetical protein